MKTKYLILFYALSSFFKFSFSQDSFHLIATMSGEQTGDRFSVVAGVGDVNCDGYDDLVVGAPGNWNYPGSGNYTKLYFGGSPFDTVADLKFVSNDQWDNFGWAVAGGGDLNGDGFSDILIGVPGYGEFQHGRVYVHYGGTQMDTVPDLVLEEFGFYYNFGQSVSMAGDVNNDGYDDLIVGAPNDDYDARGRTYIYFGGKNMDGIADVYLEGEEMDNFGCSVSWAGDVNKDEYDDILIGAQQGGTPKSIGKAYLFYGGNEIGFNNSVLFEGDSSKSYSYFGRVVSGLKDINGDLYDDFGIMSLLYIVVYSGETLEILGYIPVTEEWNSFQFLSDGGDLNNDNCYELLLGIENESIDYAGTAAIYFGYEGFDTIPEYQINGNTPFYYFASSLDYAGDINGDNYKEIIIGRREYSGPYGPVGKGTVYIYSFGNINNITEKENYSLPKHFKLFQNYPNPFNNITIIPLHLNVSSEIKIDIYDIRGRLTNNIFAGRKSTGIHNLSWNGKTNAGKDAASGVYFVVLKYQENELNTFSRKIILLK
jgi:hypothetical protein